MNDDASRREESLRRLHHSGRENNTDVPSAAVEKQPAGGWARPANAQALDRLYVDAVSALNRVIVSLDFEALPRITDILRAAAGALPDNDPARAGVLNNLGSAAQLTFVHNGQIADLDDAIWYYRAACSAADDGDPDTVLYYCNLALALSDHAGRTHDPAEAVEAVRSARSAVEQTSRRDARRGTALLRYANALKLHARLANEPSSDDRSIDVFREVVRAGRVAGTEPSELLISLGSALLRRYERGGAPTDLDEGIAHLTTGVGGMADGDPRRSALCHLANALRLRFRQDGDLADLHAALNELLGVLGVLSAGHPLIGRIVWSLACTAAEHTDSTGEPSQLRRVLRAMSPAVSAIADDDPARVMALAGFGALMRRHFLHGADTGAIDIAVAAGRSAAEGSATAARRCAVLGSLATTLITRFEHTGETEDLDGAGEAAHEAAGLAQDGSAPQHTALTQLGIIGAYRFRENSRTSELESAIDMFDRALRTMPVTAPERAAVAAHLGRALQTLYQRTGRRRLYRWARRVLTEAAAAPTSPADERLRAASLCGRLAAQAHRWSEALESFSTAVATLPLVTRGKRVIATPATQQRWAYLTADAAACALETGQPERAVELLEHGRGAILADFLPTGGELGGLHRRRPELADQTVRLRRLLDRPPEESALVDLTSDDGHTRDHLVDAWERLLDQVRAEPEERDHLRQPHFADLSIAGREGPVVLVNLSRYRSDALVISDGRVVVIPLPGASPESAAEQATLAFSAIEDRRPQKLSDALDWLWHNVAQPVLDRLKYLETSQDGSYPRIWWCVLGGLAFLPLHAATSRTGDCVLDRVISSYTPTLRALINARRRMAAESGATGFVAAGSAPDLHQSRLAARYWPTAEISAEATAPDTMLRLLSQHRWIYVGEPTTQYPAHPAAALVLDRQSAAQSLGLVELGQVATDRAEFGYLGHCATAVETPSAAALSVAGSLGFTGFLHAIGTLWEVDPTSSAYVHAQVYAALSCGDGFAVDEAGPALHRAARQLFAEQPDQPARWAGFVHFGR